MFIIEWWQALSDYHEQVMWENSEERRELAKERIQGLRDYCSGKSKVNPYKHLYVRLTPGNF